MRSVAQVLLSSSGMGDSGEGCAGWGPKLLSALLGNRSMCNSSQVESWELSKSSCLSHRAQGFCLEVAPCAPLTQYVTF